VAGDVVSVLTGRALPAQSLDAAQLQKKLSQLERHRPDSPDQLILHQRAVQQTQAQLRIASR
jgi:F0F1-type ATP synthase epsilon subunit